MINNDYLVDTEWCDDSGTNCDFLPIKDHPHLGFKNFKYKHIAEQYYGIQLKLSKFNLAPQLETEICKIPYYYDREFLNYWLPSETATNWGFITHKALLLDDNEQPTYKLQTLVDTIYDKTGMRFWDCHWNNIGYINKDELVCIDTGEESFIELHNAWGYENPGPIGFV